MSALCLDTNLCICISCFITTDNASLRVFLSPQRDSAPRRSRLLPLFPAPPLSSLHRPILLNFPFTGFLELLEPTVGRRWRLKRVTCEHLQHASGDRAGGQTSDPVTRTGATFQQGFPREPLDVSPAKMERPVSLPSSRRGDSGRSVFASYAPIPAI